MKNFFIGANWKCNGSPDIVNKLVNNLIMYKKSSNTNIDIVIAPPSIHLLNMFRKTI